MPRTRRASRKPGTARRRFVAGAIGPTNRTASISPDVNDPGFRAVTFDELAIAYGEQARGLLDGGSDILLIETIFDNAERQGGGLRHRGAVRGAGHPRAVMISGTITDLSGPHSVGQTPSAFWFATAPCPALLHRS